MNLKEHEDQRFTKEQDEVEKYLLRIIQRYFDIENNFTRESIEAIILESLTRFKQFIIAETGFIFSLNQKTGKLILTIRDFNGEPAFDKKTAFNKDFGTTTGTICEGNDIRLSDERETLEHVHILGDITKLSEELENVVWPTSHFSHTHKDFDILDMITYAGSRVQIDLILLEHLQQAIDEHCEKFIGLHQELKVIQKNGLENLQVYLPRLEQVVLNAQELIDNAITWLPDIYTYTGSSVQTWKLDALKSLLGYVTKEQGNVLVEALKKSYYRIANGEISIQDGIVSLIPVQDHTNINEVSIAQYDVSNKLQQTNNGKLKLYFRYDKDGQSITTPLPFCFQNGKDRIVIQGSHTQDGQINVSCNVMSTIQLHATVDNLYDANTVITTDSVNTDIFYYIQQRLQQDDCVLCKIDSNAKNAFVTNLLQSDVYYYIDGERSFIDNAYYDNQGEVLSYFNWADEHPLTGDEYNNIAIVNGTWKSVDGSQSLGYIAEYKIKRLTQYFENPRIYYEVLGNKEVV